MERWESGSLCFPDMVAVAKADSFSAAQQVEEVYAVSACQASQPVNAQLVTGL